MLRAAHWTAGEMADRAPPESAPRAGGCVLHPPASTMSVQWELYTKCEPKPEVASSVRAAEQVTHTGGCHCGAVRFQVVASSHLVCWDCNCSDCRMRRNVHFVVPQDALRLVTDEKGGQGGPGSLAEYRWGSGLAQHLFCACCGISPFYKPRSNPDGWAITFACLDPGTVSGVEIKTFDGQNWESCIDGQGAAIKSFSATK